jgi:hypothetical protein
MFVFARRHFCARFERTGNPGDANTWESKMRKNALLLAVLMLATAPAVALAAQTETARPKNYDTNAASTQSHMRLAQTGDQRPLSQPYAHPGQAKLAKKARKAKKKKAKKK